MKPNPEASRSDVIEQLNQIMGFELGSLIFYVHSASEVSGPESRWAGNFFHNQARECLKHARQAGEWVTDYGGHACVSAPAPSELQIPHRHGVREMLETGLMREKQGVKLYDELLGVVKNSDVTLEQWARWKIYREQGHVAEIERMLRKPDPDGGEQLIQAA